MITAAAIAGLAAALLIGPPPGAAAGRLGAAPARRGGRRWAPYGLIGLALLGVGTASGALHVAGWIAVGCIVVGTAVRLVRVERRRRRLSAARSECAGAARALAALLRAGQLPCAALAQAADDFPVLRPSAAAEQLGADVGSRLAATALEPGRSGLTPVAAAWRLSERTGAPMAEVLGNVADRVRARRRLEGVVGAELSATRASGRVMAALPLAGVLLGAATGVDSVGVLVGEPWGQYLVLGAAGLAAVGVLWIEHLADSAAGADA